MACTTRFLGRLARVLLLGAVGALLAGPVRAAPGEEPEAPRSDEAYASLIHRLELGMTALEELGRRDALEVLARVANEVRAARAAAREERASAAPGAPGGLGTPAGRLEDRATRLEILRRARAAHAEAGQADAAEVLERAVAVGELQQTGASEEEVERAAEGLSMERIVALLEAAADLRRERGDRGRAKSFQRLAEFYELREAARSAEDADETSDDDDPEDADEPADREEEPGAKVEARTLAAVETLRRRLQGLREELDRLQAEIERLQHAPR